jgi:hypothetical protein
MYVLTKRIETKLYPGQAVAEARDFPDFEKKKIQAKQC